MIWSIAWRNVWRNKLRSLVVMLSIMLGLFGGVFIIAFMNGWLMQQTDLTIKTWIGNMQIHNPQFLLNNGLEHTIDEPIQMINKIEAIDEVRGATYRASTQSMVSSAETGIGVMINGIFPEKEKEMLALHTYIKEGSWFDTKKKRPIVVSRKTAEKLKVKLNSKIVLTIADKNGNMSYNAFKIVGIYKSFNTMYDERNVFVKYDDLMPLLATPENSATEIVIKLKNDESTEIVADSIGGIFSSQIENEQIRIRTWKTLEPLLQLSMEMNQQFSMIIIIIILLALSFGIINTMLMVVMERIHEFGMLMAVGMNKLRLFGMIMFETIFLAISGGVVGLVLSSIVIVVTGNTGIDLTFLAEGLNAYGYVSVVHPKISVSFYFTVAFMVIIVAILSSMYPARKALKLNPSEAVRVEA